MILIPDIHISAKYWDKILQKLSEVFAKHPDEKEVLFLGDYIYMFSYDRAYLLRLFGLFIQLVQEGRQVRVMSWNHDWLQWHFVFEEGKQAFDLIQWQAKSAEKAKKAENGVENSGMFGMGGELNFITQPTHRVDQANNLHVIIPYNDQLALPSQSDYFDINRIATSDQLELVQTIQSLLVSSKPWERLSGMLNQIALAYYETARDKVNQIIIYHHYYTAQTQFPGVKASFHFRDGALHSWFCIFDKLKLISGHIHEPFQFNNYLCCGSFWHTSALETNECKYYFVGEPVKWFQAHMTHINPKISIEYDKQVLSLGREKLDETIVQKAFDDCVKVSVSNIQGPMIGQVISSHLEPSEVDLVIKTAGNTKDLVQDEEYIQQFHSYAVQHILAQENPQEFTSVIQSDYRSSFSDRKHLLDEYLLFKYPWQHTSLIDFMQKHSII